MISVLFAEKDGNYSTIPGLDLWDITRDARLYVGDNPVIAHPPCQRWGRFWHGSTAKPHQYKMGADDGCFESALKSVRRCGGVLEHPCDSHAWDKNFFNLPKPPRSGGWISVPSNPGDWCCCVYQGHYGHMAGKPTWLYVSGFDYKPSDLKWGKVEQRIHPAALEKHGYEKARRIGMVAMIGGKNKTKTRNETPLPFCNVLLEIAKQSRKN